MCVRQTSVDVVTTCYVCSVFAARGESYGALAVRTSKTEADSYDDHRAQGKLTFPREVEAGLGVGVMIPINIDLWGRFSDLRPVMRPLGVILLRISTKTVQLKCGCESAPVFRRRSLLLCAPSITPLPQHHLFREFSGSSRLKSVAGRHLDFNTSHPVGIISHSAACGFTKLLSLPALASRRLLRRHPSATPWR
jgi:hypothetical protein